jgi:hypothetical protein
LSFVAVLLNLRPVYAQIWDGIKFKMMPLPSHLDEVLYESAVVARLPVMSVISSEVAMPIVRGLAGID